jgi:hypothetical protein
MMTIDSDALIHRPMDEVVDFIIGTPDASIPDPQRAQRARSDPIAAEPVRFDLYEHYGAHPLAQIV